MRFSTITVLVHASLLLLLLRIPALSIAILVCYAAYHAVLAWGVTHPRSRLFGDSLSRLATRERVVVLTFDDGPHERITPRVLDLLRERRVPATFFAIGRWAARNPDLVRRIVEEGHLVGNHTYAHSYLFWTFPPRKLAREVERAQRAIETAAGTPCRFFRAPVGMRNGFLARVLRRESLRLVSWDVRFLDRAGTTRERLRARLLRRVVPGSILVLHDGHDRDPRGNPAVLETLPIVLDLLDEMGYRCVPLGSS